MEQIVVFKQWEEVEKKWEQTVTITKWEHDYVTGEYTVKFIEKL